MNRGRGLQFYPRKTHPIITSFPPAAINNKTSSDQQTAAMVYLKWILEESSIYKDENCIPAIKSAPMPDFLVDFEGIELVTNAAAPEGNEKWTSAQTELGMEILF